MKLIRGTLTILGGILTSWAIFLPWVVEKLNPDDGGRVWIRYLEAKDGEIHTLGTTVSPGRVALLAGILAIQVGIATLFARSPKLRKGLGFAAVLLGLLALNFPLYWALTHRCVSFACTERMTPAPWIAAAGGLLVVIGGALTIRHKAEGQQ